MEIYTLLETIKNIIENGRKIPFTESKRIVDEDEILDLLDEIVQKLPDELKTAKWIKEERERIIAEAHQDADNIVKEAENRIISMIDEHEITKKAYDKKSEIIAGANEMYREVKEETARYADEILANVENDIVKLSETVAGIESSIQGALEILKNNRNELK